MRDIISKFLQILGLALIGYGFYYVLQGFSADPTLEEFRSVQSGFMGFMVAGIFSMWAGSWISSTDDVEGKPENGTLSEDNEESERLFSSNRWILAVQLIGGAVFLYASSKQISLPEQATKMSELQLNSDYIPFALGGALCLFGPMIYEKFKARK